MTPSRSRATTFGIAGLSLAVVLLGFITALTYLSFRGTMETGVRRGRALEAIAQIELVLGRVRDAETGQRGYLLTGNAEYLAPYEHARTMLPGDLSTLRELLRDDPPQQERLVAFGTLLGSKLSELEAGVVLRRTRGLQAALQVVTTNVGQGTMDRIRAVVADMERGEREQAEELFAQRNRRAGRTSIAIALVSLVSAAIILLSGLALLRQIRRRETAEQRSRESERRLVVTLSSIGDAVMATDTDGRVTFMNPVAQQLTGWSESAASGRPLAEVFEIVNEETRAPVETPVARVLREGVVVGLANHTVLLARSGEVRIIDDSAAPIRDAQGRILGVVLVFRDVSERREAAEARQRYAQAEAANQAKDEFLAVLSHELRSPLNAMLGWVKLLERQPSPEVLTRAVSVLERNIVSQTQLINELLDVSRIVTGKLDLELAPLDLRPLVQDVVESLRAAAVEKGVALECRQDADGALWVAGDAERLRQVFRNLVGNALKFTPATGQVAVSVARDGDEACVVVQDSGEGIQPAFVARIFDRFTQGDSGTARRHGGLGLGLSIVKHLVDRHAGRVEAFSDGPGAGARFTVRLPLTEERCGVESPLAEGRTVLPGITVLLVEDDGDTREAFRIVLEQHGARVLMAESGEEGLAAFAQEPPTVIVSDLTMPGMDGHTFIRAVRERERARTPAIALTSLASGHDRGEALRAGFDEHVVKPVDPYDLMRVVRALALSRDLDLSRGVG